MCISYSTFLEASLSVPTAKEAWYHVNELSYGLTAPAVSPLVEESSDACLKIIPYSMDLDIVYNAFSEA